MTLLPDFATFVHSPTLSRAVFYGLCGRIARSVLVGSVHIPLLFALSQYVFVRSTRRVAAQPICATSNSIFAKSHFRVTVLNTVTSYVFSIVVISFELLNLD